MSTDTLAARLRAALVGDYTGDVMAWDELKPEIQDRWQRVADAAKLRVPFSDAQIERMAKAAHNEWHQEPSDAEWNAESDKKQREWCSVVRAALAAGGLEPCAPPEYDPADVALQPADDAWKKRIHFDCADTPDDTLFLGIGYRPNLTNAHAYFEIDSMASNRAIYLTPADAARMAAWLSSYAAAHGVPTGHVLRDRLVEAERKVENQRAELKRLNALVADLRAELARESEWVRQYKQDRDDALAELADLRDEVDDDNTNAAAVNDLLIRVQNLTAERDALRERAAVPVPAGVPSVRDLREIGVHAYLSHDSAKRENAGCMVDPMGAAADAILTALAPYLRDPVGWELDVRASDAGKPFYSQAELDWIHSRIRPVFECKECAARKARDPLVESVKYWFKAEKEARERIQAEIAARAALEGE